MSILLYGCTTWTLTKWLEKKLDGNYTRMLWAILNRSWQQHPTRRQLYGHLRPITKTIQARRTWHAGHCWRSKDEIISDVLLWTPAYGQSKAGRPARTFIQQLCDDTGCNPEDLLEAMNDRETWRERVRDICASCTTWWWWWYIYRFGLVSLFNGILTFMGDLIPKLSLLKNSSDTIWHIPGRDKKVHNFPKGISPKMNVIGELYIYIYIYIYIYKYIYTQLSCFCLYVCIDIHIHKLTKYWWPKTLAACGKNDSKCRIIAHAKFRINWLSNPSFLCVECHNNQQ